MNNQGGAVNYGFTIEFLKKEIRRSILEFKESKSLSKRIKLIKKTEALIDQSELLLIEETPHKSDKESAPSSGGG